MQLPICPNCQHRFTRKEACRAAVRTKRSTYCPNCQTTLYPTANARARSALFLAILQLVVLVVLISTNSPLGIALFIFAIYLFMVFLYLPYSYEYHEYEESLFKL
ncbi:TIGR04104 family putative zinc finger protein [Paenibacillus sp. Z6-24]